MLGSQTYTKAELLNILNHPNFFDASIILAVQLIAAKLNIANGSDPTPVSSTITHADGLLSMFSGKLPYHVNPFSYIGQMMVHDALTLVCYNNGKLTPGCCHHHGDDGPLNDPDWFCHDDDGLRHDHEPCGPCDHTPTPTPTPHHTPTPTATPHHTPTATPHHTPTATPHHTPTATPHHTPTATPHHTPTATSTSHTNTYCHIHITHQHLLPLHIIIALMGIDTARVYSGWIPGEKHRSERIVGDWLKAAGVPGADCVGHKGGTSPLR